MIPALVAALLLGGPVAAFALAVVAGAGAEPMGGSRDALLLAFAAAALVPAAMLARRCAVLRRPASLVIGPNAITISYPELLFRPLVVPRAALRVAAVESDGRERFRIHAASSPYAGGAEDGFVWSRGRSDLAVVAPTGVPPNVLLVFDPPAAAADVRSSRTGAVYRGERLAGVLLAFNGDRRQGAAMAVTGLAIIGVRVALYV